MGRRASQQATFSKGELDPDLSERLDLEQYYDSLGKATNCVFHPQGGFSDRGGFQLVSDPAVLASGVARRLRRRIFPVVVTAGMVTAANGGTVASLVDTDPATLFTTNAVTATPFVLFEVDLGAAVAVDFVDLINFASELAGIDEAIAVQYWTGSAWATFGDALGMPTARAIRTTARTRRFGVSPGGPGGVPVSARQWRVVALNAVGIGTVSIGGLAMWRETAGLSPWRLLELVRDEGAVYELVISERNADVYRDQVYVASLPLPVAAQQVRELGKAGGYDTLLLFHEMLEPIFVQRQGSHSEWNVAAPPFVNVPALASSAVFSGAQDEIQVLDLGTIQPGTYFALFLGAQLAVTTPYTNIADIATTIRGALEALPDVTSATFDVQVSWTGAGQALKIRFSGGNGGRAWPLVSAIPLEAAGVVCTTSVLQPGVDTAETYMHARTGWPRAGAFVQQRLVVGGFRAAPTSYRFSRNPTWYDFQSTGDPVTADLGFGGALDVDEVETISEIYAGRHLQIFTSSSEFFTRAEAFSATEPAGFVRATGEGYQRGVPLQLVEGGTVFLQAGGNTLREFRYVDAEQTYGADPLSVLCPHLTRDVRDTGHRLARSVSEGNLLILVNGDGTAAAITLMRAQKVVAGAPWVTDGAFRALLCGRDFRVLAVIERGGQAYLERWMPEQPLDFATHVVFTSVSATVAGAAHLANRTDVWAIADGEVLGPLTVSAGGVLTLPVAALDVVYGLAPAFGARLQTVRARLQQAQPFRAPGRIYEAELALKSTGALTIGTNGSGLQPVVLTWTGERAADAGPLATADGGAPQLPLMQRLFTGSVRVENLLGVSRHPYLEIGRPVPCPVHVKAVRYELSDKGD